jgi:hypothetical protein
VAEQVEPETADRIMRCLDAYNRRDIENALEGMTTDVAWANGWEGGVVHGHDELRDFWTRQWRELDPALLPIELTPLDDGRVAVLVDQEVRRVDAGVGGSATVMHVYSFRDGLIAAMEIHHHSPTR